MLFALLGGCTKSNDGTSNIEEVAFDYSRILDENGFWEGIRANDYVNVEKYLRLQIPRHIHYVSMGALQNEMKNFLDFYEITESELTDDFVVANLSDGIGWATVDELKEGLRLELQRELIMLYVEQHLSIGELLKPIPNHLMQYIESALVAEYRKLAEDNEMELDEFLSLTVGVSNEHELLEKFSEGNIATAIYSFTAQAIAENEGITVSQEDLDDFMLTNFGFGEYSLFENMYGRPFLMKLALYKKVVNFIIDNAILE